MISKILNSLLVLVFLVSCEQKVKKTSEIITNKDPFLSKNKIENTSITSTIPILNYDQLVPFLNKKDDKTYVVNFWATWCKPCVEELPAFEKLHSNYKDKNVEVLLVSLDFPNQIENHLIPFIKNRNLQPKVMVLDDPDQNKWINGIDKSWSGAIPATLIYNKNKRSFYEQSFDDNLLTKELQQFIN